MKTIKPLIILLSACLLGFLLPKIAYKTKLIETEAGDTISVSLNSDTALTNHSEIPHGDLKGAMDATLRRLDLSFKTDLADKLYWQYKSIYLETGEDKYRILANKQHGSYERLWNQYAEITDSLTYYYLIK